MECKKLGRQENKKFNCKKWEKEEVVTIFMVAVEEAELIDNKLSDYKELLRKCRCNNLLRWEDHLILLKMLMKAKISPFMNLSLSFIRHKTEYGLYNRNFKKSLELMEDNLRCSKWNWQKNKLFWMDTSHTENKRIKLPNLCLVLII